MRVLDLLGKRPVAAACLIGATLGALVGLFLPIRAPNQPKADSAAWLLPEAKSLERFSNEQYQSVRSARFWGPLSMPGQRSAAAAVTWTLAGIVTRPAVRIAVSMSGKPATKWISLGGEMPDGSTFVAANRDTVWYEKDGCRRARKLYRTPTTESEACIGAPAEPAAASSAAPASIPASTSPAPPPARTPP